MVSDKTDIGIPVALYSRVTSDIVLKGELYILLNADLRFEKCVEMSELFSDKIVLSRGGLQLVLARPGTYYRGTRFDWSGVFCKVECNGIDYCGRWFDTEDPFRHDNVCGPSEEFFGCMGYDEAGIGDAFLKVGVGLLKRDSDGPYDWFHCYEIIDPGIRTVDTLADAAVFVHEMPGFYSYIKTVELTDRDSFRIAHRLITSKPMQLKQYCHNFFTFGAGFVGAGRAVEFKDAVGAMECRYGEEKIGIDDHRIWATDDFKPGEKCYLGNICSTSSSGYCFLLKDGPHSVQVKCSLPMAPSVLWSNHRVFCPEPYVDLVCLPDEPLDWGIHYYLK